ncbi:MAG TPA: ISNCY family transposase [Methylomirabilota bacterium]|nr:ISNCY family transposase [Methylomirabilota bacterium]HSF04918.1 ISNCY family transposase [Methylomirabilota bacterium]
MVVARAAVERAMRMQEVIVRALSGTISWLQAADILGIHPRSLRRWRARYQADQLYGLFDHRRRPSGRRAPLGDIQHIVRVYRERYRGFNVRHFHRLARRDHGVRYSYSFVKLALQEAGLVPKGRARGRHCRRREPRPCFGELLHLDGSRHAWLARCPAERQTLIAVLDDATKQLLYAQLWPGETTEAVMTALQSVFTTHGLPIALYTDRARWAFYTPRVGGKVDPRHPTQLGRALARLGIEHIPAYSPQARGRSERLNRTLQDRLVKELQLHGVATVAAANAYLREQFIPAYNEEFARPPAEAHPAFVACEGVDLETLLCHEEERTVGPDNVVTLEAVPLQVAKQPGRRTCAGLRVLVRRHLDGRHTVWHGPRCLGVYDRHGRPVDPATAPRPTHARAHWARGARSTSRPISGYPPKRPGGPRRRGPRLPIGPRA